MADVAVKRGPGVAGETIKEVSERRTARTEAQKPALMKPKPRKRTR
jgi:hypothetical protein